LCKFIEFWQRYKDVVPPEYRDSCKAVLRTLAQRKVSDFRNKCVGHIWDKDHHQPLIHSEINRRLDVVMSNDLSAFLNSLNNPKNNVYPSTVVSVVETLRDVLMTKHSISPDEFVNR
jgi:hypothetical protein